MTFPTLACAPPPIHKRMELPWFCSWRLLVSVAQTSSVPAWHHIMSHNMFVLRSRSRQKSHQSISQEYPLRIDAQCMSHNPEQIYPYTFGIILVNMGMFSRKDKDKKKEEKKEESSAAPIQQQQQQQQEHPSLINPAPTAPPPAKENPISTEPTQQKSQNSWTDSAYQSYIGSSKSEEPQIRRQQEQKLQGHPPGTTVTTTTTTTTSKQSYCSCSNS